MNSFLLPDEYRGAWCEVKTADNELIAVGKIKVIMPKYIIINDGGHKMPEVEPGTLVKINVFKSGSEIRVCIGNVYISENTELSIVNVISLVNSEKRSFFRPISDSAPGFFPISTIRAPFGPSSSKPRGSRQPG